MDTFVLSKNPGQTLDLQMDLLRWWATPVARDYSVAFLESIQNAEYHTVKKPLSKKQLQERGKDLTDMHRVVLGRASTYHVTPNMVSLMVSAADKMEPQVLREDDLPTPYGFMYFETPMYIKDIRDETVNVQAVSWQPAKRGEIGKLYPGRGVSGIQITMYSNWRDPADTQHSILSTNLERFRESGLPVPPMVLFSNDPWEFGKDYNDIESYVPYGDPAEMIKVKGFKIHSRTRNMLFAIWSLCKQKIVTMRSVTPDRIQRKQIKRSGLLADDVDLRIITLRRREDTPVHYEGEGSADINWSHQWVVDGHWRWQRYTAGVSDDHRCPHCGDAGVEHKQIWIDSFVKGPPDKPLMAKNTVFKVRR